MVVSQRSDLHDRIQQQCQVVEGGNHAIYLYNCSEIRRLIPLMNMSDLSAEEAITIHYTLAAAYGRKLLGGPPTLRVLPEAGDGSEHVAS